MIKFVLRYTGVVPKMPRSAFNKCLRSAYGEIGVLWHRFMAKKHFTRAGFREYRYTPRAGQELPRGSKEFWKSYCGRKLRKVGHMLPLVYSGESRQLSKIRDVRPTSKGVTIKIHARALNWRPAGSKIDKRAEMTTVSDAEVERIHKVFDRRLTRKLRQYGGTQTLRI